MEAHTLQTSNDCIALRRCETAKTNDPHQVKLRSPRRLCDCRRTPWDSVATEFNSHDRTYQDKSSRGSSAPFVSESQHAENQHGKGLQAMPDAQLCQLSGGASKLNADRWGTCHIQHDSHRVLLCASSLR